MTHCAAASIAYPPDREPGPSLSWTVVEDFRKLGPAYFSDQAPSRIGANPILIHASPDAMRLLGLSAADFADPGTVRLFAGHHPVPGFAPLSQVYAGHQFGNWVPRLGDGRAMMIAQVRNEQGALWDVQLKGAGRTPYSRFGDGRAVLRSTIREYLASEAMAALGIPTTRALCLIATGEGVMRETLEPGAILTRLAPSHIRFGHFEYFRHNGMAEAIPALADHVIAMGWPDLVGREDRFTRWFEGLVQRTASLIADWQAVGFCHGVMNTDNMSALGLTIDYGPYGFLDAHDPGHICNHSDHSGRYAFASQPDIAFWNLQMLAMCLTELIPVEALRAALAAYGPAFDHALRQRMRAKLGLTLERDEDDALLESLTAMMADAGADHTLTFRRLSDLARTGNAEVWVQLFGHGFLEQATAWAARYLTRLEMEPDADRPARMDRVNPKYVPRNWVAEQAIRVVEDEGDLAAFDRIFQALTDPFSDRPGDEALAAPPSFDMAMLAVSCSS